jgi:hypothetical protein
MNCISHPPKLAPSDKPLIRQTAPSFARDERYFLLPYLYGSKGFKASFEKEF